MGIFITLTNVIIGFLLLFCTNVNYFYVSTNLFLTNVKWVILIIILKYNTHYISILNNLFIVFV